MRKEIKITVKPVLALAGGHNYRVTKLVNAVRVECDGKQDMEEGMLDTSIEAIESVTRKAKRARAKDRATQHSDRRTQNSDCRLRIRTGSHHTTMNNLVSRESLGNKSQLVNGSSDASFLARPPARVPIHGSGQTLSAI